MGIMASGLGFIRASGLGFIRASGLVITASGVGFIRVSGLGFIRASVLGFNQASGLGSVTVNLKSEIGGLGRIVRVGGVLNLRTTTSQKCAPVPRRARI